MDACVKTISSITRRHLGGRRNYAPVKQKKKSASGGLVTTCTYEVEVKNSEWLP